MTQIDRKMLLAKLSDMSVLNSNFVEVELLLDQKLAAETALTDSLVSNSEFEIKLTKSGDIVVMYSSRAIAMHYFEENVDTLCNLINSILRKYLFIVTELKTTTHKTDSVELWHGETKKSVHSAYTFFLVNFDATEEEIMNLISEEDEVYGT